MLAIFQSTLLKKNWKSLSQAPIFWAFFAVAWKSQYYPPPSFRPKIVEGGGNTVWNLGIYLKVFKIEIYKIDMMCCIKFSKNSSRRTHCPSFQKNQDVNFSEFQNMKIFSCIVKEIHQICLKSVILLSCCPTHPTLIPISTKRLRELGWYKS